LKLESQGIITSKPGIENSFASFAMDRPQPRRKSCPQGIGLDRFDPSQLGGRKLSEMEPSIFRMKLPFPPWKRMFSRWKLSFAHWKLPFSRRQRAFALWKLHFFTLATSRCTLEMVFCTVAMRACTMEIVRSLEDCLVYSMG